MADKDYFSRLRETSLGQDLYQYLLSRNNLPKVNREYIAHNGVYNPFLNSIKLHPNSGNGTLTHEMAHAADATLTNQYFDRPGFAGEPFLETYFTDAYKKLKGNGRTADNNYTDPREDLAKKLSPSWYEKERRYRASNNELVGWGAGTQAEMRDGGYKPPNHLDSTMATELSILMELARRNDIPFPKQPSWFEKLFK